MMESSTSGSDEEEDEPSSRSNSNEPYNERYGRHNTKSSFFLIDFTDTDLVSSLLKWFRLSLDIPEQNSTSMRPSWTSR